VASSVRRYHFGGSGHRHHYRVDRREGLGIRGDWGAVAACTVIVTNAFLIVRTSVYDATDRAVSPELRDSISAAAAAQPGVTKIEKCLVRKSGTKLFVELHVEIDPLITIGQGHAIGHQVKAALLAANPRIQDVVVHLEPHGREDAAQPQPRLSVRR
jgi:divalent metal cation (Fe/Co/Zn/Cd) transporter